MKVIDVYALVISAGFIMMTVAWLRTRQQLGQLKEHLETSADHIKAIVSWSSSLEEDMRNRFPEEFSKRAMKSPFMELDFGNFMRSLYVLKEVILARTK